jgi:hypothetical protein
MTLALIMFEMLKRKAMKLYRIFFLFLMVNTLAKAQEVPNDNSTVTYVELDGPRFGATVLTGEIAKELQNTFGASPFITQFGWQVEKQFFVLPTGTTGVVEFVGLVGGIEQGLFLPSLSSLVGIRSGAGTEFGVGPNLSIAGFSLVLAAGITVQRHGVNFPINLAFVPSSRGARFSLLFGFNAISPSNRRNLWR